MATMLIWLLVAVALAFVIAAVTMWFVGRLARRRLPEAMEAAARTGADTLRVAPMVQSYGVASAGRGQLRGNGVLILTTGELRFDMWSPQRRLVIPLAAVLRVDTTKAARRQVLRAAAAARHLARRGWSRGRRRVGAQRPRRVGPGARGGGAGRADGRRCVAAGRRRGRAPSPWGGVMKKLINRPEDVVREALQGFARAHGDRLKVLTDPACIVRADAPVPGKVAIVSGGGSGHEPMHGGFVGPGMLDAACPGEVFTSPTPDQMLAATKAVDGGAGVLHIVKNYTGDVMNFEMAAELARDEGIDVEQVVIDDDVAVQDSLYTAGRRGVGTTVLAEKICGAAAEQGRPLEEVAELCRKVNANGRSMGMALTSCTVPMAGRPTFDLGAD